MAGIKSNPTFNVGVKQRIEKLRREIDKFRYEYHVLDRPEVSDEIFDSLMRELRQLEEKYPEFRSQDSPSQRIGGEPLKKFEKVRHSHRQWSLDDAFSFEEVKAWEEKFLRLLAKRQGSTFPLSDKSSNSSRSNLSPEYCAEIKIDGLITRPNIQCWGKDKRRIFHNIRLLSFHKMC
ncbi:MAG: hypothetical protein NT170_02010 [Candidatus Moranbacteria bacterium]|nr:hypothetical protein [Candidatus Moranbacteria bacterium]